MRQLHHRLLYGLLYGISLLPLPVLYGISTLLYVVLYHIIRYRRSVVFNNLRRAFPERSQVELHALERDYYRRLADLLMEVIKAISIAPQELHRRCSFSERFERHFQQLFDCGRHCIVLMGHLGNWEWACLSMSLRFPIVLQPVYQPLKSRFFDALMLGLRKRFGSNPIPMSHAARALLQAPARPTCTVLISDQSPPAGQGSWFLFLGQMTPFHHTGMRLAIRSGHQVLFARVMRLRRGYYHIDADLLETISQDDGAEQLLKAYIQLMEQEIRKDPPQWLWSHRRWKHASPGSNL